jgi:hypothetical protein
MARKLAFLLLPLLLLLAACNSGGGNGGSPTEVADPPGSDAEATDDDAVATDEATPDDTDTSSGDDGDTDGDPFASLNPFDVLNSLDGSATMGTPDPTLAAALLTAGDLPGGFMDGGSFGMSMPTEGGTVDLAMSMFMSGDIDSGEFDAMVMSAVMALPPEALAELEGEDFALSDDDLDEIESMIGETDLGVGIGDIAVLDAAGLGDGGFGMHMTMDFAGLFGALGAPEEDNPFADGISMDMFAFIDGDQMRMVIVMAPAGGSTGVDARDLAETMDAK